MGPAEQSLAKQCYAAGLPLPDRIANAPELRLGLMIYLQAFFDLDSERSHGMGLTRIPWTSIKEYAVAYEFDADQTDDLLYFIKKMDSSHLERLEAIKQ